MDKTELKQKSAKLWHELHISYYATKKLLIHAEEKLSAMELYPAPLLEHRDALDHLMNYSKLFEKSGLSEATVNELANAKQHEIRAFFDVADYICITIRKEISDTLGTLSQKKIDLVWPEYREIRVRVIDLSNQIAEIRNGTRETVDAIPHYEDAVYEMFKIYADFQTDVQPKIGHGFIYQLRMLVKDIFS